MRNLLRHLQSRIFLSSPLERGLNLPLTADPSMERGRIISRVKVVRALSRMSQAKKFVLHGICLRRTSRLQNF